MHAEQSSIHDFDFSLICEYYSKLERQGPGSPEVTARALDFVVPLPENMRIADIGCGTGGQTMVLARRTTGRITGLDPFPDFIDRFNANARMLGLQERVRGVVGTMEALPFARDELDLLWSEGAIYNIGFARGLNEWRPFLKTGGFIAVSEASWFTDERPAEIDSFWRNEYPEIDTIARKVGQMQAAGYIPMATFVLPETCWLDHFYLPQVAVQEQFLQKHAGYIAAEELVENQRHEAALYAKYKQYYGYVFYIGKKI